MVKVPATFEFENSLWGSGKNLIVGIDEVGRGAWAGPLVAAAVIFPRNYSSDLKFYDSKMLVAAEREKLSKIIQKEAVCFGVGLVEVEEIIKNGLTLANQLAFRRALKNLTCIPDHYLIDAFYIRRVAKKHQTPIIHGDALSATIAAASIVAKVYRDNLMRSLARTYKEYKFGLNKGYGTAAHQDAIRKYGFSPIHRTNYDLKFLLDNNHAISI